MEKEDKISKSWADKRLFKRIDIIWDYCPSRFFKKIQEIFKSGIQDIKYKRGQRFKTPAIVFLVASRKLRFSCNLNFHQKYS